MIACGLNTDEIKNVIQMTGDIEALSKKLVPEMIDSWDNRQLQKCIDIPTNLCNFSGIELFGNETIYHLADYHNQFNMSYEGKMHLFLQGFKAPVWPQDILRFKISDTLWGKNHGGDIFRRYNNIHKVCCA